MKKRILASIFIVMFILSLFTCTVTAEKADGKSLNNQGAEDNGLFSFQLSHPSLLAAGQSTDLAINVPTEAEYEITLLFIPADNNTKQIEYSLKFDGQYPFDGADVLTANSIYEDDGEVITLSNGSQTAPAQKQIDGIMKSVIRDNTGVQLKPYTTKLSARTHTVNVQCLGNDFNFYGIEISKPEEVKQYAQVLSNYSASKYDGEKIIIEAEKPIYRNDFSLTGKSDPSSGDISPKDAKNSLINYIGGSTWSSPNQELTWEFKAPKEGLYRIGFSFKQNTIINGNVYRALKIDGKTPFAEAEKVAFSYKTAWQYKNFSDENGEDYLFYLSEGEHTISLSVTLGDVAEIYETLKGICENIGKTYLDVVMITSENPDANRDYELYKQIPNFQENLQDYYEKLTELSKILNTRKDINGQLDGAIKNMARISKQMHDNKYSSHLYLNTYYSYYQTISSWLYDIKNMALALDKIVISAPGAKLDTGRLNAFEKIGFSFQKFMLSFVGDYASNTIDNNDSKTIKIWVNWGRDQVKVLQTLIQESFSAKTGINVRLEQVNASIVQGIISNNSPDLYLHLARTEPVNLAMRGVLYDLSSFSDYNDVLKNFQKNAELPYIYNNKCYALPDTQNFYIMFCRDDILNELGIKAPKTWDDFLSATSIVQRKNMNTYLPYTRITAATTVNTGAGGLTIYPTMLMQSGEKLYNSELNATTLGSKNSVNVFTEWTEFYSKYKLNPDVNFYQRFRVGTIPLGVAAYTNYLTFAVAASEIQGKWSIHTIPGTVTADGTINYNSTGSGTGCSIMKSTKHPDAAWEFLKWWVSEDTQYSYSLNVEAILGASGRVATSNVEALSRLSWDKKDLQIISDQWKNVTELEEVPGSYYVSRSIDQAFWTVYNGTKKENAALKNWGKVANEEITEKIKEYSGKGG